MTSESWPEWFYSHFIGRDLAYLFSGGLFICITEYSLWDEIFLPQQFSLELFGFLLISYFLGLLLYDMQCRVFPSLNLSSIPNYPSGFLLLQDLLENYDIKVINLRERTIYLRVVGISVGSSVLWGGVLMIIVAISRWLIEAFHPSVYYIMLTFSLLFLGIYMFVYAKRVNSALYKINSDLVANIVSKNGR